MAHTANLAVTNTTGAEQAIQITMATLYGKNYSRAELLARVGDMSQLARVKAYRLCEGLEDNVRALDVSTGSGLSFTVLPSRGMDISSAHYNGRALMWRSSTTDTHPAYFDHEGENGRGWLRGFYGGLVVTCGLSYAGANGVDNGLLYGLHGRISNLPATNVRWEGRWEGDDYLLSVSGTVREATVFGENLQMTRTLTAHLGEKRFFLTDIVENIGAHSAEHMMLYHINIGFPVVNDRARLISPTLSVVPRDSDAAEDALHYAGMQPPRRGYREKVYFHDLAADMDGSVTTAVVNPDAAPHDDSAGLGVYCRFLPEQLPHFTEWKMMDAATYVVGMEPGNCLVMGRAKERDRGALQTLAPGEQRRYDLELGVLAGGAEISQLDDLSTRAVARARSDSSQ